MFDTISQDVRHGIRMLLKNPGFSLVAVLSIAIGVGANTAMFSVADGLILRPLKLPDAAGLVTISGRTPTGELRTAGTSYPDYLDLRDRARSFTGLAASRALIVGVARQRNESAQGVFGQAVSVNFFDVLRVQPALGAGSCPRKAWSPAAMPWWCWRTRRGRSSSAPMPAWSDSRFGSTDSRSQSSESRPRDSTALSSSSPPPSTCHWRCCRRSAGSAARPARPSRRRTLAVVGRLTPGVTLAQSDQEVVAIARALEQQHPESNDRRGMLVRWERDARFAEFRQIRR